MACGFASCQMTGIVFTDKVVCVQHLFSNAHTYREKQRANHVDGLHDFS